MSSKQNFKYLPGTSYRNIFVFGDDYKKVRDRAPQWAKYFVRCSDGYVAFEDVSDCDKFAANLKRTERGRAWRPLNTQKY